MPTLAVSVGVFNSGDSVGCEITKKPIVFVAIPELERTLSEAIAATFMQALTSCNSDDKFWGWRLDSVHKDLVSGANASQRKYPFADELSTLLPWWDEIK